MDYETYRTRTFVDPAPEPRFAAAGLYGAALYFQDYEAAVAYYTKVLGPPAYVEGDFTRGWRLGDAWLTLFPAKDGVPSNTELQILVDTAEEAERLQAAFIGAGGTGEAPEDALMFEPLRFCSVRDPFGTSLLILARLSEKP